MMINYFRTPGSTRIHFRISQLQTLNGSVADAIRSEIEQLLITGADSIYLDTTQTRDVDLSGVNEIMHTHYRLASSSVDFVLVYRKGSPMEKWIEIVGMNKLMSTALIPE